ncbi:hypothetical protein MRX96_047232 [Rhipicephalus microplus]
MLNGAAPLLARKRKFVLKAKPSSGSRSRSPEDLPSRTKKAFSELFAHPEMHARSDDQAATTERGAPELRSNDEIQAAPEKTSCHEFQADFTSHIIPAVAESERVDKTSRLVEGETIFKSKGGTIEVGKSRCCSTYGIPYVEHQLRRMRQVQGPSNLGELLSALTTSEIRDVLQRYATLTAFVEQLPRFIRLMETRRHLCITKSLTMKYETSADHGMS